MITETWVDESGRVIESEVMPDDQRDFTVGKVTSKSPPLVKIPQRPDPVPINARAVGMTVEIGDLVAVFRVSQVGNAAHNSLLTQRNHVS